MEYICATQLIFVMLRNKDDGNSDCDEPHWLKLFSQLDLESYSPPVVLEPCSIFRAFVSLCSLAYDVFLFCKETSSATYFFWVFAVLLGNFLSLFGSGDDNMEGLIDIFSTIADHHVQFYHHHHQQHHLGLEARSAAWARDFAPAVADEDVDEDFFTTDFNSFELLLSFSSKLVLVCNCRGWLISTLSNIFGPHQHLLSSPFHNQLTNEGQTYQQLFDLFFITNLWFGVG